MSSEDLKQYEISSEPQNKPIEYIKIVHNTKGYNWEFGVIGKPEEMYERVKLIIANLSLICNIDMIKDKIEKIKKEELEQ